MEYQKYSFNRIAEYLVYNTLRNKIITTLDFPKNDSKSNNKYNIYFQTPSDQYVNTRTETQTDPNREEIRYPSLSFWTTKEEDVSALNNSYEYQSSNVIVSGKVVSYESRYINCSHIEMLMETSNKKDFFLWKQKLKMFLDIHKHGFMIENDLLPIVAGSVGIQYKDSVDSTDEMPFQTLFSIKLYYRIFHEFEAYTFNNYKLFAAIFPENDTSTINDDRELNLEEWNGSNPYPNL